MRGPVPAPPPLLPPRPASPDRRPLAADSKLKKVPEKLLKLTKLRTLDLSKNALGEIPEPLGGMVGMKQFNIAHNSVAALPPSLFGGWKSCEVINLSGNRLTALPELGGMPRLKKLLLNGNALRELPESIGGCAKLEILEAKLNALATMCAHSLPAPLAPDEIRQRR